MQSAMMGRSQHVGRLWRFTHYSLPQLEQTLFTYTQHLSVCVLALYIDNIPSPVFAVLWTQQTVIPKHLSSAFTPLALHTQTSQAYQPDSSVEWLTIVAYAHYVTNESEGVKWTHKHGSTFRYGYH